MSAPASILIKNGTVVTATDQYNNTALKVLRVGVPADQSPRTDPFTFCAIDSRPVPGNNAQSTITFIFDRNYQTRGNPSIVINLSTPGCESTPIRNP